ncbi:serine threonine protein kinase [Leptolyngbya sp. Heron Island J]|uniref:NACHT domain-containing protein n=1 Tax=Leptolyngbya sp. Heron Island J TaxID=1385935 RepID=UPI0003B9BE7E|nr:NACHT domain-containing protein [Leptolyngbya sp. Heron Island J]ESA37132.1 serine threonine protein kinase [Leptolyngbya sp. Heron Island J]
MPIPPLLTQKVKLKEQYRNEKSSNSYQQILARDFGKGAQTRVIEKIAEKYGKQTGNNTTNLNKFLRGTEPSLYQYARRFCEAIWPNWDENRWDDWLDPIEDVPTKRNSKKVLEAEAVTSWKSKQPRKFEGREYVFTAFENYRKENTKGCFILVGDPGEGKSAIVAELIRQNKEKENRNFLYHFNQRGGYRTATEFLENISNQLVSRFSISEGTKQKKSYQNGIYFEKVLTEAAQQLQGQQLIIAIDALDEVDLASQQDDRANVLYLPERIPEGVFFFLTKRREAALQGRLNFGPDQKIFDFLDYGKDTEIGRTITNDIRQYIEQYLDSETYPEYAQKIQDWLSKTSNKQDKFITTLMARSQRNFMYLYNVIPQFVPGGIYQDLEKPDELPLGLMEYYRDHWQRMGMTRPDRSEVEVHIIYLLTESYSWIPASIIAKYASISVGERVSQIRVVDHFKRWMQFLHSFLVEGEKCYLIYHESFNDFLHQEDTIQASKADISCVKRNYRSALYGFLLNASDDPDDDDDGDDY